MPISGPLFIPHCSKLLNMIGTLAKVVSLSVDIMSEIIPKHVRHGRWGTKLLIRECSGSSFVSPSPTPPTYELIMTATTYTVRTNSFIKCCCGSLAAALRRPSRSPCQSVTAWSERFAPTHGDLPHRPHRPGCSRLARPGI